MQHINIKGKPYPFLISLFVMSQCEKEYGYQIPDFEKAPLENIAVFFMLCFQDGVRRAQKESLEVLKPPFDDVSDFIDCLDINADEYDENLLSCLILATEEELKKKVARIINNKQKKASDLLKNYSSIILKD